MLSWKVVAYVGTRRQCRLLGFGTETEKHDDFLELQQGHTNGFERKIVLDAKVGDYTPDPKYFP